LKAIAWRLSNEVTLPVGKACLHHYAQGTFQQLFPASRLTTYSVLLSAGRLLILFFIENLGKQRVNLSPEQG